MSTATRTNRSGAVLFSAAPPSIAGPLSRSTIIQVLLGLGMVGIVGLVELPLNLAILGALAMLIVMLISPVVGLYAVLFAVGFSPTFGIEDAAFSISAFEPLLLLVFLFWLLQGIIRHQITLPREGLFGGLILLLTVLLLAGAGATSYPLAIKETLKWLLLVLAYIYARATITTDRAARHLLIALFVTGAAEALMGMAQFFLVMGPPGFAVGPFIRAHGMFGQPNPFAGYLGTILPIALAMSMVPHPGRFRAIAGVSFVMIAVGIVLSLSRGAWLGLVISLGVMALAWSPRARTLLLPLIASIALIVVMAQVGLLPPNLASRITSVTDNFGIFDVRNVPPTSENFAVVERMAHWQAGWEMFRDYPLLGVGPGNYPAVYERYFIPPWRDALGHAHNYYLNMAAEAGLLGLLALLTVLGLAFRAIVRRIRATTGLDSVSQANHAGAPGSRASSLVFDPPFSPVFARALALGLLGSLSMFCIHNLFDNLLVHGVGIQIGVLLGLIGGVSHR